MKNQWQIGLGFIIPLIFWATTLLCGFILPSYSHATRMVSELGEIGTETQHVFTIGLVLTAIASIFFNIGLFKSCRLNGLSVIPIVILWVFSFSILGAGLFPFPLSMHGLLGSPSIVLFLSPLTALILWKNNLGSNVKVVSFLVLIFMLLGFLVFAPNCMTDYFGIKQRLFHSAWTIWFIYLSVLFIRLNKRVESRETGSL